jgi:hypothetical protein
LLKKNKDESLNNCHSSDLSLHDAEVVCARAGHLFSYHKSKLEDEKRREAEDNLDRGAADHSHPHHNTEEERSVFMIDRSIKRLIGAIYRAKSVEEVVSNTQATKDTVSKAEFLITELNSLSHNIKTLTENNEKIRTELRNRNISLTEDALTTFMDLPSDFGDID